MSERTPEVQKNTALEQLLADLRTSLEPAEEARPARDAPQRPIVLIVGPPRSGTTLLMQWLAASGCFAYPTNLIGRFFAAPSIGFDIQRLLFDSQFDFNGELSSGRDHDEAFRSTLGKTRGPLQPSEFWYFWRRFFDVQAASRMTPEDFAASDGAGFLRGLARWEARAELPIAMKGILLQYNLKELDELLPNVVFLHTHREPFFIMQSLLEARRRYTGSEDGWFSVQPPGWQRLLELNPVEQVAGQVWLTQQHIQRELGTVAADRQVHVQYEDFCEDTSTVWKELCRCFDAQGFDLPPHHAAPAAFPTGNQTRVAPNRADRLDVAWRHIPHLMKEPS